MATCGRFHDRHDVIGAGRPSRLQHDVSYGPRDARLRRERADRLADCGSFRSNAAFEEQSIALRELGPGTVQRIFEVVCEPGCRVDARRSEHIAKINLEPGETMAGGGFGERHRILLGK
jgi:hypothetical protein